MKPGEIIPRAGSIPCNDALEAVALDVENKSDHAISVTSHYHFFEANKRLRFDRRAAYGRHLNIPAGSAMRWKPGETRRVDLVEFRGRRQVFGFHGLVNGPLSAQQLEKALARATAEGFATVGS